MSEVVSRVAADPLRLAVLGYLVGDRTHIALGSAIGDLFERGEVAASSVAVGEDKFAFEYQQECEYPVNVLMVIELDSFVRKAVNGMVDALTEQVFDGDRPLLVSRVGDPMQMDADDFALALALDPVLLPNTCGSYFKLVLATEKLVCSAKAVVWVTFDERDSRLLATAAVRCSLV